MSLFLNKWRIGCVAILWLACGASPSHAMTLRDLFQDPSLTPESLIRRFANFKFKLIDGVQPRPVFLASQTGDCDDFATLAADVLRAKGYTPHLVAVFMAKQTHVVCYVAETGVYLDYNNRGKAVPLVPTNGRLADIANKVALSFHSTWRCVSEYTSKNGIQRTISTEFPQS
ncbi:MAG TPA: hypothetical protein VFC07_08530 [Verrucomicrobiae bacterium]|nr:hypothetical protein [Verrucomicrobiae bacterium]